MATILGGSWVNAMTDQKSPATVHMQFMLQLGNYITSNVTLIGTFTGSLISFPFTPLTVPVTIKINGAPTGTYSVSFSDPKDGDGESQWNDWIDQVYTGIQQSVILDPIILPTGVVYAFPLIKKTFNRSVLNAVHKSNYDDPQTPVLDKLATCIMNDMKTQPVKSFPATYAATHMGTVTCTVANTP